MKKMSPYLVIKYRDQKYKTFVDGEAGNSAHWNDSFNIPIYSLVDEIYFGVYDDGLIYDELLGSTEVLLSDFLQNHNS